MPDNKTNFKQLVSQLEKKEILLPDFQREFVWKDEDQQKNLIASVLTKMPVGAILLLKASPDDYRSKKLGCKKELDTSALSGEVNFLLDGQQRITVLANVFSNVIHDDDTRASDLIAPIALKRRFFLRIPRWKDADKAVDLFGVRNFSFKPENPDTDFPDFLTGAVKPFIEFETFKGGDKKPFNPKEDLSVFLDDFCVGNAEGYLIPLFLLVPSGDKVKIEHIHTRLRTIMRKIAGSISDEIYDHYESLPSAKEKREFLSTIFHDRNDVDAILPEGTLDDLTGEDKKKLRQHLDDRADYWREQFIKYLESCLDSMEMSQIIVSASQRGRAIDIYENLNRGGVSLNTFDLLMAKVAKVNSRNYHERIIEDMKAGKSYSDSVLTESMSGIVSPLIISGYNATVRSGCYNEKRNEINPKYLDCFLDVLGLYCSNPALDPKQIKVEQIKKDQILELDPKQIDANTEKIITALDRAMFFFQTRCGIRLISDINNSLMIVLVAAIFLKDEWFYSKKVHDLLEGWNWSALFSGEFDKDQNSRMIENLQKIIQTLNGERDNKWLIQMKDDIFNMPNFSNKDMILMKRAKEDDRYPKVSLRSYVCQYWLSKTYPDMFEDNLTISVFCNKSLEAHHIVPLGSCKKYGESTKELRKDDANICNSPVNFVLITSESNGTISDKNLQDYRKAVKPAACHELCLDSFISSANEKVVTDTSEAEKFLENRFGQIQTEIQNRVAKVIAAYA